MVSRLRMLVSMDSLFTRHAFQWLGITIGTCETAIHFVIYEQIKKFLRESKEEVSLVDYMAAAGLAKFTASSMCYPHGEHSPTTCLGV